MLLRPTTATGLAAVPPPRAALHVPLTDLAGPVARTAAARVLGAASSALAIRSGLGTGPWDTLAAATDQLSGVGVGAVGAAQSAAFALAAWRLGARVHPLLLGTHALVGAVAVDWLLPRVPLAAGVGHALGYLGGALTCGVAGAVLVLATPEARTAYDHLLVSLAARGGWGVRRTRWTLDLPALLAGWALGGATGPGTAACALLVGPLSQAAARRRLTPRR